ncbi:MAG: SpoIIE family protein phosphatase [Pirellulaceae bacterium]
MPLPAYLEITSPKLGTGHYALDDDLVTIGRAADNKVVVPDSALSRNHARIVRRADGFYVVDCGSTNGTLLNGELISREAPLANGDVIRLCDARVVFHSAVEDDEPGSVQTSLEMPTSDLTDTRLLGSDARVAEFLGAVARLSRNLLESATPREVFNDVLAVTCDVLNAQRGVVLWAEGDSRDLVARATHIGPRQRPVTVPRSISEHVLRSNTSVVTQADGSRVGREELDGNDTALCTPICHDRRPVGLIYIDRSSADAGLFNETDLSLLTICANLAAAKLENLRLAEEARVKSILENELQVAAQIHASLLPVADPQIEGWQLAGVSRATRRVGGDLYDFLTIDSRRLGVVVADVSGKGISASLVMASLQASIRALARRSSDISRMLQDVNAAIYNEGRMKFATLIYLLLDLETGRADYVNAAHNPALLVRSDGAIERLTCGGHVVGAFPAVDAYEKRSVDFQSGDMLLLYTDGVTEAVSPEDEFFGDTRLEQFVRAHHHRPAAEIRDTLLARIEDFCGDCAHGDDETIVVIRRT